MIAKQEQMVNKADLSAHGLAKLNNNNYEVNLAQSMLRMLMKVDYAQKNISYYTEMCQRRSATRKVGNLIRHVSYTPRTLNQTPRRV